jgi:phosphoinositide-3-kinase regulatory subunit 4
MQVFRTASTENEAVMPKTPSRPLNKSTTKDARRSGNYKYRIDELNDPPVRHPGIRSLLPLPGGDLLTGGTDLKIRYWDQARFNFIWAVHSFINIFSLPPDIMTFLHFL